MSSPLKKMLHSHLTIPHSSPPMVAFSIQCMNIQESLSPSCLLLCTPRRVSFPKGLSAPADSSLPSGTALQLLRDGCHWQHLGALSPTQEAPGAWGALMAPSSSSSSLSPLPGLRAPPSAFPVPPSQAVPSLLLPCTPCLHSPARPRMCFSTRHPPR